MGVKVIGRCVLGRLPKITAILVGLLMGVPIWAQDLPVDPAFGEAMQAISDEDYETAADVVASSDALTRDLTLWMQHRAGVGTFEQMAAFIAKRPDWPGLSRIRSRAEPLLDEDEATATPDQIIAFFEGAEVETGKGAVAYAIALISQGRQPEAEAMLVDLWLNSGLTTDGHQAIINAFPDVVAPHHSARADMLLWRWRTSDAENVLPLLEEGEQALIRARIAAINREGDVQVRDALVPDRLKDDAGLNYDHFNWFADRGDWTQATILLMEASSSADTLGVPWRWGSWRRILARWQMREGNIERAYTMASEHFIQPDESNYDDLEWLSGYLALTYLKDYDLALTHFQNFDASVSSPISKGRSGYWLGRAYEGLGNAEAAIAAFQAGAEHQTSFYGLLAAEKLGLTLNPDIAGGEYFGPWQDAPILDNELVRAGLSLLDANQRGLAVLFFVQAAETMSRQDIGQLGQLFMDIEEPFYAILIAKTAVRSGLLVQDVYFPIHPMAELDLPVEPALALAIARQESEFRTDAGSSVGALGLMQLMPGTAREVAGWLDMPFSQGRLTSDWGYNAALGSEYLAYLTSEFGESPVMIAAGYNAGPSRPKTWMSDFGDPRVGFGNDDPVDVIDWIEHIPFRETRNYVMRVTEGIPVYRARLTGEIGPVQFLDILAGEQRVIRPRARASDATLIVPEQTAPTTQTVVTITRPTQRPTGQAPPAPSGPQPVRPVSRAGD